MPYLAAKHNVWNVTYPYTHPLNTFSLMMQATQSMRYCSENCIEVAWNPMSYMSKYACMALYTAAAQQAVVYKKKNHFQ
ncbi:hypothetical protein QL285_066221 [Trifolium repens]|nr:hypothetical protein QL285_066221 [Trifolium repens]